MEEREREIQSILNSLPTQSLNAVNRLRQMGREAIPALAVALQYPDPTIRAGAARAIAKLKDAAGVPALSEATDDADSGVRLAAILGLSDMPGGEAVHGLADALKAKHGLVRDCAARALARRSLGDLRAALHDPDPVARAAAAHGVGYYARDRKSVPRLRVLLHDENHDVRVMAVRALAWVAVRHHDALPILFEGLRHDDDDVRANAAHALGRVANRAACGPLVAALQDPSRRVVLEAIRSLGAIDADVPGGRIGAGDGRAIPALLDLLRGEDPEARLAAAGAIAFILGSDHETPRDQHAVPALVAALQDPDARVRAMAASALADAGDPTALPALADALSDPVWTVRASAASALGALGNEATVPLLQSARGDLDIAVSHRAERALQQLRQRLS